MELEGLKTDIDEIANKYRSVDPGMMAGRWSTKLGDNFVLQAAWKRVCRAINSESRAQIETGAKPLWQTIKAKLTIILRFLFDMGIFGLYVYIIIKDAKEMDWLFFIVVGLLAALAILCWLDNRRRNKKNEYDDIPHMSFDILFSGIEYSTLNLLIMTLMFPLSIALFMFFMAVLRLADETILATTRFLLMEDLLMGLTEVTALSPEPEVE